MPTKQAATEIPQQFDMEAAAALPYAPQILPSRRGTLAGCGACKESINAHFDNDGSWLGCRQVPEGTRFFLMPVPADRQTIGSNRTRPHPATTKPSSVRKFNRARYLATIPKGKDIGDLELGSGEHRPKVLKAVLSLGGADQGTLVRDIIKKTGLSNSSVQQAMSWLRAHRYVRAFEDPAPE